MGSRKGTKENEKKKGDCHFGSQVVFPYGLVCLRSCCFLVAAQDRASLSAPQSASFPQCLPPFVFYGLCSALVGLFTVKRPPLFWARTNDDNRIAFQRHRPLRSTRARKLSLFRGLEEHQWPRFVKKPTPCHCSSQKPQASAARPSWLLPGKGELAATGAHWLEKSSQGQDRDRHKRESMSGTKKFRPTANEQAHDPTNPCWHDPGLPFSPLQLRSLLLQLRCLRKKRRGLPKSGNPQ